jgi:drug/metabolite transporter (DMT)-like permease
MANGLTNQRTRRTIIFLSVAVIANSLGNLLLALGMSRMPNFAQVDLTHYLSSIFHNPFLPAGAALSATYAICQLSLFSWADLSFVVPCLASSYVVSTLLAEFVIGEQVELVRWCGVLLICFGDMLVAKTPVTTKPHSTGASS